MSWTSTPCSGKLNARELNRIVDSQLQNPGATKITDRSGWTNQDGLHRFTLAELEPGHEPENPIRKMVVVTLVQQQGGMVYTKHLDESSGPAKTDCPMRILKQTEKCPPANANAEKWRANVREYHRLRLGTNEILKELKADYPNGDRTIVINSYNGEFDPETRQAVTVQKQAIFSQTRQRRRTVNTFRLPGDSILYRLDPSRINIEATRELRTRTKVPEEQKAGGL